MPVRAAVTAELTGRPGNAASPTGPITVSSGLITMAYVPELDPPVAKPRKRVPRSPGRPPAFWISGAMALVRWLSWSWPAAERAWSTVR